MLFIYFCFLDFINILFLKSKMIQHVIIILFYLTIVVTQNISKQNTVYIDEKCFEVPDLFIRNRTRELKCCQAILNKLYTSWYYQGAYLSRTLATLKAWNCPEFDEVCSNRLLAFTDYSSLVYDRFCNESSLIQRCGMIVTEAWSEIGKFQNKQ